jgi:hypothetical protein
MLDPRGLLDIRTRNGVRASRRCSGRGVSFGYTIASDGDTIDLYYRASPQCAAAPELCSYWLDPDGHSDEQNDRRYKSV